MGEFSALLQSHTVIPCNLAAAPLNFMAASQDTIQSTGQWSPESVPLTSAFTVVRTWERIITFNGNVLQYTWMVHKSIPSKHGVLYEQYRVKYKNTQLTVRGTP